MYLILLQYSILYLFLVKTLERARSNLAGVVPPENSDTSAVSNSRTTRNKAKRELQTDGNDEQKADSNVKKVKAE